MSLSSIYTAAKPDAGRRERKRRQTLDHLADTAFRLFEARGYDAVTMEQIAAEADLAKGTLYNHFAVKEALLAHRFHRELADGAPKLQASLQGLAGFVPRMTHLLHASAKWSEAHRAYMAHYLRFRLANADLGEDNGKVQHPHSGLDRMFEALIRAGQQAGELRTGLPSEQLAQMFQFLYMGALIRWLGLPDGNLQREFTGILDVFFSGLIARPAGKKK
jgi:AcrR family transcriptional regulator